MNPSVINETRDAQHTVFIADLRVRLRDSLHEAEKAAANYRSRRRQLKTRFPDQAAYIVAKRDDYTVQDAAATLGFHQQMAGLYAAVLGGEAAAEQLLTSAARRRGTAS